MASNDPAHRRNRSTPQSIPLQDLNRPPDDTFEEIGLEPNRRRSHSDRGRNLFRQRDGAEGRPRWNNQYDAIEESPTRRLQPPRIVTGGGNNTRAHQEIEEYSPLEDRSGFQAAIGGFAGLSFQGETSYSTAPTPTPYTNYTGRQRPSIDIPDENDAYVGSHGEGRHHAYLSTDEDTTPLTDTRHLQPISGTEQRSPREQSERSTSFQNIRFLTPEGSPSGRLGDDLRDHDAEAGLSPSSALKRSGSRHLSLSPSSPLQRASTIMRNMSMRVVNMSNEQDVAERTIRRKSSIKDEQHENDSRERLQAPPSFPAFTEYAHDGGSSPIEKVNLGRSDSQSKCYNPLRGKSLGTFSAESTLRRKLCDLLVNPMTEPFVFLVILVHTVLLAADSRRSVYDDQRAKEWGSSWIDNAILGIFVFYTLELIIRVIVSGFIINPVEYSTINRKVGLKQAIINKGQEFFAVTRQPSVKKVGNTFEPSILRSFTLAQAQVDTPDEPGTGDSRQAQRKRLAHRAFLRHSFNRLDFLAVVSYWISFVLAITGVEGEKHQYVFRMLSCLRILRLLSLTSGTTVIIRSLKKAAPLLVNVAFLIGFFWLLFAIVAVQSFKASLRRTCVWVDPEGVQGNFTQAEQFCGGYTHNVTGLAMPWVREDGSNGTGTKGYLCPVNSICVEGQNPYNGTVSFDNIFQSLELIFVIMSSNTWSDLMYYLTDAEYMAAAIFFGVGILILSLWLISLLVAVITSSFQVIREESKTSAFTGHDSEPVPEVISRPKQRINALKQFYERTAWIWVLVIAYGLICQCLRSATMGEGRRTFIDVSEMGVTVVLLFEIIIRFIIDWRHFHTSRQNLVDAGIAIITAVIQIPAIKDAHDGRAYAWLTVFQIMRIYRVVLAVPMTRELIMIVLGNVSGLLNLILFVFLLTFLAAIFASQLLRGDIPDKDDGGETIRTTFFTMYNSFLGMYQILSSENWTSILYTVTNYNRKWDTAWIGAAFFIIWFILANFIVLNMFIAVIQESFDVSEDEKRLQQVKAFIQRKDAGNSAGGNLSLSTIFKFGQHTGQRKDPLDFGSAATEMLLKDAVVKDFLDEPGEAHHTPHLNTRPTLRPAPTMPLVNAGSINNMWSTFVGRLRHREPNPFYSRLEFSKAQEELDPREMAKEVVSATERRKRAQREYLQKHPNYNVSLFLFKPDSRIRRYCQRVVGPGRGGSRIEGVDPSVPIWYAFSAFIYAAIIAMVVLACVTTPLYQREYFLDHKFSVKNWFVFSDMGFAVLFTIEAIIKVVADGVFFTPNAYFRGSWGFIDGVVLLTLWINIITALVNEGHVSRIVGAFKALRALRLLNVSDSARNTFHSLIVRGWWKLLSAAFVSLSLLIPFAIYGLNLFNGRMQSCNDDSAGFNLTDCVGEYNSTPFEWDVLAPRRASNPAYDFDNFGNSLLILFQIVSQEGWTDVMWTAESITGVFTQPRPFAQEGNAVFFVVFNLLGAVFVLTLFVSVFMRNYTEQTGVAFLTADQRSWLELRKLLRQISPSKRPASSKKRETWEEWCYHRAVRKSGRWQRFITLVLVLHLILLCTEYYPGVLWWDRARDVVFLFFILLYLSNIVIRIVGLSWRRFQRSSWDLYSLLVVSGSLISMILLFTDWDRRTYIQIHKYWLVSIALLIIPRNNQLDQLFKTAAASLASIANLLATWFVLFLVFAIALTQTFGLTRFGENESGNVNFRSVPKALILLFRTSIGEGWNALMEDFAVIEPPYCTMGEKYFESDCGSPEWARFLFIAWNILSMYIFVNLFISLIYESFSYVYQRSSGLSVISREEIRRYKQAWAEFDPTGTGYISKEAFPRLLGELSGVLEMRIYDGDFTVGSLIEQCNKSGQRQRTSALPTQNYEGNREIDLDMLNAKLSKLDLAEVRRKRHRLNIFYEEVMVSSDPDRGIGFNSLLTILAHHKVINDNKSLRLEEFLRRRARLQRVEEAVRRSVVVGFFDTLYWSRRFRKHMDVRHSGRMTTIPQFRVPEIFIDDQDITNHPQEHFDPSDAPTSLSPLITATTRPGDSQPTSPVNLTRSRQNSIQISPSASPTRGVSPIGTPRQSDGDWQFAQSLSRPPSPLDRSSPEQGRSRANSSVSAQDALDVFENSAWGESIRRSFTQRRPPGQ